MRYPYRASNWRSRTAVPRALAGALLSAALLAAALAWMALDLAAARGAGGLCGWGLLVGLVAAFAWVGVLAASNALVVTADLELAEDALVVWLAGRWPVRVALEDVQADKAVQVIYRLGNAERVKGPLIRPRRRFQAAIFVPARRVSGWRFVFWAVGQMYGGRRSGPGVVVTPDHEGYVALLERLRVG